MVITASNSFNGAAKFYRNGVFVGTLPSGQFFVSNGGCIVLGRQSLSGCSGTNWAGNVSIKYLTIWV